MSPSCMWAWLCVFSWLVWGLKWWAGNAGQSPDLFIHNCFRQRWLCLALLTAVWLASLSSLCTHLSPDTMTDGHFTNGALKQTSTTCHTCTEITTLTQSTFRTRIQSPNAGSIAHLWICAWGNTKKPHQQYTRNTYCTHILYVIAASKGVPQGSVLGSLLFTLHINNRGCPHQKNNNIGILCRT